MTAARIAPVASAHLPGLLALNRAHERETSALDAAALDALVRQAFRASMAHASMAHASMTHGTAAVAGEAVAAFLIALDQDADYASPNFLWFRERFARFVYVDRVVVAPDWRGHGLGQALYADLLAQAAAAGHARLACEINSDPPNPASDAFHARLGFREVGRAVIPGGKAVRYLVREDLSG
ncbi:GNAT family N-acetyltransferase [Methylobacterium oryzisoli]|uniref:GNAT family N-acetyltransferase n=1 Tax=Methylobacterium oryzisoli TaxID=3385502 RepID=UPI003891E3E6